MDLSNIIIKTIYFSFEKETMLVSLINFLIITNIFFHKSKLTMIYYFIIVLLYFVLSERKNKLIIFFVYCAFALTCLFMESFIITITNKSTYQYNSSNKIGNVPLWLFSAYLAMVINIFLFYDYFSLILT